MLRSVAGIDQMHAPGTLVVNVRFSKSMFAGSDHRARVQSLVRGYFDLGGMQLQVNVIDQAMLEAAMADPDKYGDMIIRIGGFSEYWKNLTPALRKSVLENDLKRFAHTITHNRASLITVSTSLLIIYHL